MASVNVRAAETLQDADTAVRAAADAQREFLKLDQRQVDHIFQAVGHKARLHALELAKLAVEESGIGKVEDKVRPRTYTKTLL
jgi:acetaldehyde dehydrogenase (acetylating)